MHSNESFGSDFDETSDQKSMAIANEDQALTVRQFNSINGHNFQMLRSSEGSEEFARSIR